MLNILVAARFCSQPVPRLPWILLWITRLYMPWDLSRMGMPRNSPRFQNSNIRSQKWWRVGQRSFENGSEHRFSRRHPDRGSGGFGLRFCLRNGVVRLR